MLNRNMKMDMMIVCRPGSCRPGSCGPYLISVDTCPFSAEPTYLSDPDEVARIQQKRQEVRQYLDEKVAVSEQAYAIVYSIVKKLDKDLAKFEVYVFNVLFKKHDNCGHPFQKLLLIVCFVFLCPFPGFTHIL